MNQETPVKSPGLPIFAFIGMLTAGFAFGHLFTAQMYEKRVKTWYNKAVDYGYGVAIYRAIAITKVSKTSDPMDKEAEQTVDEVATKMMKLLRKDEAAK